MEWLYLAWDTLAGFQPEHAVRWLSETWPVPAWLLVPLIVAAFYGALSLIADLVAPKR